MSEDSHILEYQFLDRLMVQNAEMRSTLETLLYRIKLLQIDETGHQYEALINQIEECFKIVDNVKGV